MLFSHNTIGRRALRQPADAEPATRDALFICGATETSSSQERGEIVPHAIKGYFRVPLNH